MDLKRYKIKITCAIIVLSSLFIANSAHALAFCDLFADSEDWFTVESTSWVSRSVRDYTRAVGEAPIPCSYVEETIREEQRNTCIVERDENNEDEDMDRPETFSGCITNVVDYSGALEYETCLQVHWPAGLDQIPIDERRFSCIFGDELAIFAASWAPKHTIEFDTALVFLDKSQVIGHDPDNRAVITNIPDNPVGKELIIDGRRDDGTDVVIRNAPHKDDTSLRIKPDAARKFNKLVIKNIVFEGVPIIFEDSPDNISNIDIRIENCTFRNAGVSSNRPAIYVGSGWDVKIKDSSFTIDNDSLRNHVTPEDYAIVFKGEGNVATCDFADGRSGVKMYGPHVNDVSLGMNELHNGVGAETHMLRGSCSATASPPTVEVTGREDGYLVEVDPEGVAAAGENSSWYIYLYKVRYGLPNYRMKEYLPLFASFGNARNYFYARMNLDTDPSNIDPIRGQGDTFQLELTENDVDFQEGEELALVTTYNARGQRCIVERSFGLRNLDLEDDESTDENESEYPVGVDRDRGWELDYLYDNHGVCENGLCRKIDTTLSGRFFDGRDFDEEEPIPGELVCPEGEHEVGGACEPIGDGAIQDDDNDDEIEDDDPDDIEPDPAVDEPAIIECSDGTTLIDGECVMEIESGGSGCAISDTRSFNIDSLIPYLFLLVVTFCLRRRYDARLSS